VVIVIMIVVVVVIVIVIAMLSSVRASRCILVCGSTPRGTGVQPAARRRGARMSRRRCAARSRPLPLHRRLHVSAQRHVLPRR
jgi:hypothetical protein